MDRYTESLPKWPVLVWFKNLKSYEWARLGGIIFSCIAACLLMEAICTEYWVKRFVNGIFVFRGLWADCQLGKCSLLKKIPSSYGAVIYGTRSLASTETSQKLSDSDLAITLSFFSGCIGGLGLFNFMRFATDEPNTFLSWSMVPGWLSIVVAAMAGFSTLLSTAQEIKQYSS
ncbi:claudin domain-containing protein 2-like [Erythrolamprus reginae]|uniref:claudin domain-containing protein 2-like n=1 Tax=Erythrolamprus reginae TaxID=121349 RepID=UPI00396CBEF3